MEIKTEEITSLLKQQLKEFQVELDVLTMNIPFHLFLPFL